MPRFGHVALGALLTVTLGLAVDQVYLTRAGADAVYMDTLRLLWELSQFHEGRISLVELWGYHGTAHSGLIFQGLLAANVSWFGLDTLLANRLTGVAIAATALLLCASYLSDLRRAGNAQGKVLPIMVVVTTVWLCFSFSGYELLTIDLGLGLWLKNLLIFALFLAHAETLRSPRKLNYPAVFALSTYGVFVIVLCAMGWSYAVVGAVVAVQGLHHLAVRKGPTLQQAALPLALTIAQLAVTVGKRSYFGRTDESQVVLSMDSLRQWLLSLASTFINGETAARLAVPAVLLVVLGGVLATGFLIVTFIRLLDRRASLMPVHLIAYATLCAFSFVMARGALGDDAVMASRYHMDLFPGLVGLLWIASMPAHGALRLPKWSSIGLVVGLTCLTTWFQLRETFVEWSVAPYRNIAFSAMNEALLSGVPNEAAAILLQSPIADARNGTDVMRRERLAVFRSAEATPAALKMCSLAWRMGEGWYSHEASGTWSSALATFEVPACACQYLVDIFIPANYSPRTMKVTHEASEAPFATLQLVPGSLSELAVPASATPRQYILTSSRTTIPADKGINEDIRSLGVHMGEPRVNCATSP
jgi:hypothetical protein